METTNVNIHLLRDKSRGKSLVSLEKKIAGTEYLQFTCNCYAAVKTIVSLEFTDELVIGPSANYAS